MPTEYFLSYALAPERTLRRPLTVGLVDEHGDVNKIRLSNRLPVTKS
jgi:hypothetical protein